jgi:hypothetical protein
MFRSIRFPTQPDPTDADSMLAAVQAGARGGGVPEVRAPVELGGHSFGQRAHRPRAGAG